MAGVIFNVPVKWVKLENDSPDPLVFTWAFPEAYHKSGPKKIPTTDHLVLGLTLGLALGWALDFNPGYLQADHSSLYSCP
jgi:hypothetical protein